MRLTGRLPSSLALVLAALVLLPASAIALGAAAPAPLDPSPSPNVPTPRPFDPRSDRLSPDTTPELNLAGRSGVALPDLGGQRARHPVGGLPPTPTAPLASIPGLISREDAIAKAPLAAAGETIARIEAKLVAPGDLAEAGNGIGGVREVDYIWVVARWGQFSGRRFGAPLVRDKQQQSPPPPEGWRFILVDARRGDVYVGGGSMAEAAWWSRIPDRSNDRTR